MGKRALLLVDAAPPAGLGHLARSTGLAQALPEAGFDPVCVAVGASGPVERGGTSWIPAPSLEAALAEADGADLVIVDSYELPLDSVREGFGGAPLAAFWDQGEPPEVEFLIAFGLEVPEARGVSGPEYACLGRDYWDQPPVRERGPVERVFVSAGGADIADAAGGFSAAVQGALPDAEVILARGGHPSLRPLLLEADLAVTAAGVTMVEAAACGTPCIASPVAPNQRPGAELLSGLGAVRVSEPGAGEELERLIAELAASPDARRGLSDRAVRAVDGRGAQRIAAALRRMKPSA